MANRPSSIALVVASLALTLVLASPSLDAGELLHPLPVIVKTNDGEKLSGKMTAYDTSGFDLVDEDDKTSKVSWRRLHPGRVYAMHDHLLSRDDANAWLTLGSLLYDMKDGRRFGERSLQRALAIDESLADKAEAIRRGEGGPGQEKEAEQAETEQAEAKPAEEAGGDKAGEQQIRQAIRELLGGGEVDLWGELPDELMEASVAELDAFAKRTEETLDLRLARYETSFFLVYTDLPASEAQMWARQIDRMYDRLCRIFDIDRGKNIFRGKCIVFIFRRNADYHRFEKEMHGTDSSDSAGMCHTYSNGYVHVAFFRQPDKSRFAHILVHETVHGFVHRYQSSARVVSWINEGLAEFVATEVAKNRRNDRMVGHFAQMYLRDNPVLDDRFFAAEHIIGDHYPVAKELTAFMISVGGKRYAKFVEAIKDGKPWPQALEEDFGTTRSQLVKAFGDHLRVPLRD